MVAEPFRVGSTELAAAGVDPFDEAVYRQLLGRPTATPAELASELGHSTERIAKALDRLRDAGLVGRMSGRRRSYSAVEPEAAINALVRERALELERVRIAAGSFAELFSATRDSGGDEVDIIPNREALGRWFVRLQQEAQEEMITLDRPPYALTTSNPVEQKAISRGVRYRVVYAPEALTWPGVMDDIRELVHHGEEARVLAGVRVKVAIADRRLALMPLSLDLANARAAVIRPSALLDALIDYWELCWRVAAPLDVMRPEGGAGWTGDHVAGGPQGPGESDGRAASDGAEPPQVSDADRMVLALLVSGLKDEAIARQFGWSVRTMRRRMSRLTEELNAANRFQAGVNAVRRGWV